MVSHVHVPVPRLQLAQHLRQAPGAGDPADVVVLLVGRAAAVGLHQSTLERGFADKVGRGISGAFEAGQIPIPDSVCYLTFTSCSMRGPRVLCAVSKSYRTWRRSQTAALVPK